MKTIRTPKISFSLEQARSLALGKIGAKGAKGSGSPVSAAMKEPKRSLLEKALADLESERAIFVERSGKKPLFLLAEFAPNTHTVSIKVDQLAAQKHPELLTAIQLKKAAGKIEQAFFSTALEALEESRGLLRLLRGKSVLYAHGASLRAFLGVPEASTELDPDAVAQAYGELVRSTGFPDAEIAALQRAVGFPMDALKEWLRSENRHGRAIFGLGDWSLADESTRAGVIEMRGDRYLLVRLER